MRLRTALTLAACLALLVAATARAASERRVALVIGNAAYRTAPLKNPVNDATDMAATLKQLGFDVTLKLNARLKDMDQAVRDFGVKLRQGGVGLFFFAGHGIQVAGENYLVPVDAEIQSETDVRYGCLNAGLVLGKMEDAGNQLNVVILDACRNNPFGRGFRSAERGLAKMDAPTGSLIAYATAPGSVAADGERRNGVYTENLLKNLKTPGFSITDVFMQTRMGVLSATGKKQVPWETSSLTGYFYLAGPGKDAAKAAAPAVPAADAEAGIATARLEQERARLEQEKIRLEREKQLAVLETERKRLEEERLRLEQAKLAPAAPARVQPSGSRIVLSEDFAANTRGWSVNPAWQYYSTDMRDGHYFLETKNDKCSVEVIPLPGDLSPNFDVELVSVWKYGKNNSGYGLALGRDRDNNYHFVISGNAQAAIWANENNQPKPDLLSWRQMSSIRQGDGRAANIQKVDVRGTTMTYSVNGQVVGQVNNLYGYPLSVVGVRVCYQQMVAFDHLTVIEK
jgi:uncharacterized caspase-like protein